MPANLLETKSSMRPFSNSDHAFKWVMETSVIINLNASRHAKAILTSFPFAGAVVDEVGRELERGLQRGRQDSGALAKLVQDELVTEVRLGEKGLRFFRRLVAGHTTLSLGDGEAATISYCLEHGAAVPVIDERKANRICSNEFPALETASTVDILANEEVQSYLGRQLLTEAVFNALHDGRMRVLAHHAEWVFNLIGPERAAMCPSIRKYV